MEIKYVDVRAGFTPLAVLNNKATYSKFLAQRYKLINQSFTYWKGAGTHVFYLRV